MTLLARLFLIVAIAVLPAMAVQAYDAYVLRDHLVERAREDLLQLARLQSANLDRVVAEARDFAVSLAELNFVRDPDPALCAPYLRRVLPHFPQYASVAIANRDGHAFCAPPELMNANIADRPAFRQAMESGTFSIGVFAMGRVSHKRLLPFAAPILGEDGASNGVLILSLDLDWLAEHTAIGLPRGTSINIADRDGTILVRHPDNGKWSGQGMPEQNLWILHEPHEGVTEVAGIDGKLRVIAYEPLAVAPYGLHVGVTIEKAALVAGVDAAMRDSLMLTVVAAVLAAFAAWFLGQRLVRDPVGQLLATMRRWRGGDYAARAAVEGVREIGQLGGAFNDMVEAIAARDAALRQAEEKALQQEKDFSRLLVENISEAILAYDRELRVTAWNPAMERLTGYQRGDVLGRKLCDLLPLGRDEAAAAAFHGALAGRRTTLQSHRYDIAATGRSGLFDGDFTPLSDADGEIVGGVAFVRDTTERHRLEEAVRRAQRMEAVGQLTGGIAHDFNNLLTVIGGSIDRIAPALGGDDRLQRLLELARNGVQRGARLTQRLLAFARRQRLNPVLVDANALVRDCRELLRRGAGEAVEFELALAPQVWPCRIDPAQFEAALLNLVINAHDAMPSGGRLTIATENVELAPEIVLTSMDVAPGAYVMVAVADTGTGMPPEVVQRAFEPFFTTKEAGKGSGLGLSQVYGFVKQSGGHVVAESEPGAGTTIRLYLPRSDGAVAATEPGGAAPAEVQGSERVLLIDDDAAILETTAGLLEELGYRVVRARDGREALSRLEAGETVDLVFSDIVLPGGMSGLQVAAAVSERWPRVRILLTTGYAASLAPGDERWPVLPKPYQRETLAARLREVLAA